MNLKTLEGIAEARELVAEILVNNVKAGVATDVAYLDPSPLVTLLRDASQDLNASFGRNIEIAKAQMAFVQAGGKIEGMPDPPPAVVTP